MGKKTAPCRWPTPFLSRQVSFLEAAHPVADKADTFRLYYGGSDAVVGTALVSFERVPGAQCE